MAEKEDYYQKLLQQRRDEKSSPYRLARAPSDFYGATHAFIDELRELLEKELRESPLSEKMDLLRSRYQKSVAHAAEIVELRMGKIATLATQVALTGIEMENLLPEEKGLFEEILRSLRDFKERETPTTAPKKTPATAVASAKTTQADAGGTMVVRIVAEGQGLPLETYSDTVIHKEEILTLPEREARLLIDSRRAIPIDTSRCS